MTDWVTPPEGKLVSPLARAALDTNWCPTPILAGSPLSDGGATVAASWTLWASFSVLATISVLAVIPRCLRIGDWLIRLAV
jgi:hypothetical protein